MRLSSHKSNKHTSKYYNNYNGQCKNKYLTENWNKTTLKYKKKTQTINSKNKQKSLILKINNNP